MRVYFNYILSLSLLIFPYACLNKKNRVKLTKTTAGRNIMYRLLLVEDDLEICEIIQFYLLENEQYNLTVAHTAEHALQLADKISFDLVLLDIMLPGMDGISFCEQLRKKSFCPVIFLSCINDDETIIRALNTGGDDYLVKPFKAPMLMARIEANLRRMEMLKGKSGTLKCRELSADTERREVKKGERLILLSPTEYEILVYLLQHKNSFASYDDIYQSVWQHPSLGDYRALFVHIRHLRQKLEDDPANPAYILTHMLGGYILSD